MAAKKIRQTQFERRDEAERRIIEATIRLISQRGFANLTLSEIGEEAGYSRGLPAHYFGKKDTLLLAVATHILGEFRRYAYRNVLPSTKPTFEQVLRIYVKAVKHNPDITRATVMIYSEALVNPVIAGRIQEIIRQRIEALAADIRLEIEAGRMSASLDPECEAAAIFAFLRGALMLHAIDPKFPLEDTFEAFSVHIHDRMFDHAAS